MKSFPCGFSCRLCPFYPKWGICGRTAKGRPCWSTSDFSHTLVSIFWGVHLMLELVRSKNSSWHSHPLKYYLTATTLPVWIPSLSAQTYENECSRLSCLFPSSPGVLSLKQMTITMKGTKPSMPLDFLQVHPCSSPAVHPLPCALLYLVDFLLNFYFSCLWLNVLLCT